MSPNDEVNTEDVKGDARFLALISENFFKEIDDEIRKSGIKKYADGYRQIVVLGMNEFKKRNGRENAKKNG